jgi:DedD protein
VASGKVAQETPAPAASAAEPKIVQAPANADKKAEPETKPAAKPEAKAKADDAAKARALLDGKTIDTAAGSGRFVVQVGAFAEEAKARQAQQKLERAGLKNYRQVAETDEGKRIRVRAGPFASRSEADKAAEKIKGLDLPARILSL